MAKILVADDNSNVQKTVTLALAGLGVDVLAVNNGDAAVRKLADFSPDLVLADIFMPVRNGYEVCEYVKKDNRFANVPVVLLVGAFDPLDEKEAQRVGADGILKKPFVPTEPLITMVKMLLERTLGERLVEVSASNNAVVARARSGGSGSAETRQPVAVAAEEPPAQDFPPPPGRVAFGDGEPPVAFSQLLEPPVNDAAAPATELIEPVDDEQILTSSRDATLGDPIFWRNDEPEAEPEPGIEDLDDVSTPLGIRSWKQGDASMSRREDTLLQPIEPIEAIEPVVPVDREALDAPHEFISEEQDEAPNTIVESGSIVLDAAGQASLTVDSEQAKELAANPIEWMATVPEPTAVAPKDSGPEPLQGQSLENASGDDSENASENASEHTSELGPELTPEFKPEFQLDQSENELEETPGWDEPIPESADTIDAAEEISSAAKSASKEIDQQNEHRIGHQIEHQIELEPEHSTKHEPEHQEILVPVSASEPLPVSPSVKIHVPTSGPDSASTPASAHAPTEPLVPAASPVANLVAALSVASVTNPAAMKSETKPVELTPESNKPQPPVRPPMQAAEDTAHAVPKQNWADLVETLRSRTSQIAPQKPSPTPEPAPPVAAATIEKPQSAGAMPGAAPSPDPALVEAVVQRVLDKMRPQVVDIITKEFLRPIVQALVTREIVKH